MITVTICCEQAYDNHIPILLLRHTFICIQVCYCVPYCLGMPKDPDGAQHLLIGGDRLTEANCRNVQWGFSDADTEEERMEGMHFKFEDWHAIRVLFEVRDHVKNNKNVHYLVIYNT